LLSEGETRFVLNERWGHLGVTEQAEDWTSQEAITTIVRITAGNVRLIHRLLMQVERILQINELHTVTKEVVEAARENLVIGLA
jgi:Holliday junction resolvasome RuvABC ATP-dependent DNA helicase subunit